MAILHSLNGQPNDMIVIDTVTGTVLESSGLKFISVERIEDIAQVMGINLYDIDGDAEIAEYAFEYASDLYC